MAQVKICVDHLEALAHAARAYDRAAKEMHEILPNNFNDLEFYPGPVRVEIGGVDTGWRLDRWDAATWLVVDTKHPDVF